MKQKFPKMVYLTRESYKIVQNESELKNALSQGFRLHWQDPVVVRSDSERAEPIEAKVEAIIQKPKKKKWQR